MGLLTTFWPVHLIKYSESHWKCVCVRACVCVCVCVLLLLLLPSRLSPVRLCATPQTATHQAPPPLGFSRQEHWSGLPFPSPVHESEKWKWSRSVVSDSATPWTAAYQAPPSMGFSKQEYWSVVPLPSLVCVCVCVCVCVWIHGEMSYTE